MGIFDTTKGARPSEGGLYFPKDFKGIVMINRCKKDVTRKKIEFAAIECVAVTSNHAELKPGMPATEQIMENWDGAGSMLIDFGLVAGEELTGNKPDVSAVDSKFLDAIFGEDQLVAGKLFHVTTFGKNGKDFTHHRWACLTPEQKLEGAAVAKQLGLAAEAGKKVA